MAAGGADEEDEEEAEESSPSKGGAATKPQSLADLMPKVDIRCVYVYLCVPVSLKYIYVCFVYNV